MELEQASLSLGVKIRLVRHICRFHTDIKKTCRHTFPQYQSDPKLFLKMFFKRNILVSWILLIHHCLSNPTSRCRQGREPVEIYRFTEWYSTLLFCQHMSLSLFASAPKEEIQRPSQEAYFNKVPFVFWLNPALQNGFKWSLNQIHWVWLWTR